MQKALIAFIAVGCALPAAAADLNGTWSVSGDISGYPVQLSCNFAQKDSDLSGVCKGGDRPDRKLTGQVNGKSVRFEYDVDYEGNKMHVVYSGTLESDTSMKGSVDASGYAGSFQATKQ